MPPPPAEQWPYTTEAMALLAWAREHMGTLLLPFEIKTIKFLTKIEAETKERTSKDGKI